MTDHPSQPTKIATALGRIYGYIVPRRAAAFTAWPCQCTQPGLPKRVTVCPVCRGSEQVYSVP